jgi:diacylglycerol kinase family enzyme
MKCYVLFNPLAGKDKNKPDASIFSEIGAEALIYIDITTLRDHSDFLKSLQKDDILVLCGGDGTLNRFINDTEGLPMPCDILYLARGTGNDFLQDIGGHADGIPVKINDYIRDLPCAEVCGKTYRFLNNVGFGIDGYCCEVGDAQKKTSEKPVNYTAIAIKGLLLHYKPTNATVTVDGQAYHYRKVWLAPTMKGRYYGGGMMATPAQDRNDVEGNLSLLVFHGSGKLHTLAVFPSIFKGTHIKHKKIVSIHKGKNIHVVFDRPSTIQIDGETITGVTEYTAKAKIASLV